MFEKRVSEFIKNPVWFRVTSFSLVLFFIFLGDAILSFWVPTLLEDNLGALGMGLVMSFSSVVGFIMDLIFPQLIQGVTVKRLVTFSAATSLLFSITLLASLQLPVVWIFLIAMAIWGIYYEFFGFAEQQFIADTLPLKLRSSGWAFFGVFKNLAYFLGPLMAAWIVLKGEWLPVASAIIFTTVGFGLLTLFKKTHERRFDIEFEKVNILSELIHWKVLFAYVWPVVALSLVLGLIDSAFWTTGTVLTEKYAESNALGALFLPLYQLPSLFIGLFMARFSIFEGKKKKAIILLALAGLILSLIGFSSSLFVILGIVLASSVLLSICYPLVNAVYSDIVARMGRERKHLIGLSNSALSMAYIIGPALAGYITKLVGEEKTFSVMGAIAFIVSLILLGLTPKKIRLPEKEIKAWE